MRRGGRVHPESPPCELVLSHRLGRLWTTESALSPPFTK